MVIFTKDMSTGATLTHGVSGFPCVGRAGDFQIQNRGEPWQAIVNDPILSYLNAQSHIGIPLSNFNEPWTGGMLQDGNFSNNLYPGPIFGEQLSAPPPAPKALITVAPIDYPSQLGNTLNQQMPNARIHSRIPLPAIDRQNMVFEMGTINGDNKVFMPQANIFVQPNTEYFQGATNSTATHVQNDIAGQQTTANTTRADFTQGQGPYAKLPNGQAVGQLQPGEAPALYELAPPPDPQVLPGEGTGMLAPTVPKWW